MQKIYPSNKGIALVTTLILSLVCLGLMLALIRFLMSGSQISSSLKHYTSALEAARGGVQDFLITLSQTEFNVAPSDTRWISGHNCKVNNDSSLWGTVCSSICVASVCTSHSSPTDIINYPDWVAVYGSYSVYVKIVQIKGMPDGYFYSLDIVSRNNTSSEMAWLTVLLKVAP